ncbi:unnamed protein product [Clonostachys solani]|uniref:Uncharacterized protein n=1 Tax=Clonostachys solani TaxID=160281 RepID=A0A9N9VXU3_9HYPO|nr:unnamed protein product [Clonostachys solani]
MKFGQDFKETLATQDFPSHWVEHAIPYGQLKKCLKKVLKELKDLGLDHDTLQSLIDPENHSPVALKYRLIASENSDIVKPTLTVDVYLEDDVIVEASLTPASRLFFEKIASEVRHGHQADSGSTSGNSSDAGQDDDVSVQDQSSEPQHRKNRRHETIELPLVFDHEFFQLLQNDVSSIDSLQDTERQQMSDEIRALGEDLAQITKPRKVHRTDMIPWRNIFELYLDAEVFFATHEQEHGARSSQLALKKLQWFQGEVKKRELQRIFKIPQSQVAYDRFLRINANLLKMLQFQEINQLAVHKILKKFDKRTSFGISKSFRSAIQSHQFMTGAIGRDVCAQMSQHLTNVVPQLNDYLCPICFMVAYRPVKLECSHIFCLRCIIKIQRSRESHCPLCRSDVVMKATIMNLDDDLAKYMKKHFPTEVSDKERHNQIERGLEDYGPGYKHQECSVM